jgi:hypothetical protein
MIADRDCAQNFTTHTKQYVVADPCHAFTPAICPVHNADARVDCAIVADDHTVRNLNSEAGMHGEAPANHSARPYIGRIAG